MSTEPMEITQYNHASLVRPEEMELTVEEIVAKVQKVRNVAEKVMRDGVHFGTIPGTPKPTLYKAGGEILCLTFRLAPKYEKEIIELGNGHREYVIKCDLFHIHTGAFFGSGLGSCSTMEAKYRYRPGPVEPTGKAVPKEYWDFRQSDPKKALALIGGKGFTTKKIDGKWEICRAGEIVENPNIADCYNTALKIGCKRAYIDSVLKATAASEVYTQDLKDEDDHIADPNDVDAEHTAPIQQPQRKSESAAPSNGNGKDNVISDPRRKRLYAISKTAGYTDEQFKAVISACGYASSTDILVRHYEVICEFIEGTPLEQVGAKINELTKWCAEN